MLARHVTEHVYRQRHGRPERHGDAEPAERAVSEAGERELRGPVASMIPAGTVIRSIATAPAPKKMMLNVPMNSAIAFCVSV